VLTYLHMRDFALIEDLSLELYPGLNVLTGETGAGKSVILGAVNLILGERASSEQIRAGSEQAIIEAIFHPPQNYGELEEAIEEQGLPFEGELIFAREITRSGRNICRINGRIVPLAVLRELGSHLVDFHGQHTQQSLLKPEKHLHLLDEFGDEELFDELHKTGKLYNSLQKMKEKLRSLGAAPEEREKQLEILTYRRDEIKDAALSTEEEEALAQRMLLLDNMEKLLTVVNKAYLELYGGDSLSAAVLDKVNTFKEEMESHIAADPKLLPFIEVLEEVGTNLAELGHELYAYQEGLSFSPGERGQVEKRLEVYRHLKRKYGKTIEELHFFAEKCDQEIDFLRNSEEEALSLQKEALVLEKELEKSANLLTEKRKGTAKKLEAMVKTVLKELGMENARFAVQFEAKDVSGRGGKDATEFLFSANPGEPLKPLARIISAGEMARVMLALKSILAEQDRIPTLVFDEIDSGIGGETIKKVAEKMSQLGQKHQVICVTHSAHIASAAHHQYHIFKDVLEGKTYVEVKYLEGKERVLEIVRLLDGGSESEITKQHAKELLEKAQEG
jgi:DNA repair protein RecN (Recombination protein N)